MANTPTPHIAANPGDFAQTVLMPGDPLRARHIAETYLTDPVLVNNVRGVQGYTGLYQGKRVSVMASGMGMPAIGIYCYKLLRRADETAEKLGIPLHIGTFLSTDVFYECPLGPEAARLGAIACEMEAAALYVNAMQAGKHALCLCTISDNENGELAPEERQKSLTDMFRLALEIA